MDGLDAPERPSGRGRPALRSPSVGAPALHGRDLSAARELARRNSGVPWELTGSTPLRFDGHHPQGMVLVGDLLWISTVDVDRRRGQLLCADTRGRLQATIPLHPRGAAAYHPGGMDCDGEALWLPLAEYHPGGRSSILRFDLATGGLETVIEVDGHVGAAAHLGASHEVVGWTWGSRELVLWDVDGRELQRRVNQGRLTDWQDLHVIDGRTAICGGVSAAPRGATDQRQRGSVALMSPADLTIIHEVAFDDHTARGRVGTENPITVDSVDGRPHLLLLPDDGRGSVLRYPI